jgi:hypothetical protein
VFRVKEVTNKNLRVDEDKFFFKGGAAADKKRDRNNKANITPGNHDLPRGHRGWYKGKHAAGGERQHHGEEGQADRGGSAWRRRSRRRSLEETGADSAKILRLYQALEVLKEQKRKNKQDEAVPGDSSPRRRWSS